MGIIALTPVSATRACVVAERRAGVVAPHPRAQPAGENHRNGSVHARQRSISRAMPRSSASMR